MKNSLSSALCLTVLATSAFADTQLADIRTHADQVRKGSEQVTLLLKAKQPDAQAIRDGITAMGGGIENLERLVVELTAANPQFIQRGDKNWDLLKERVQLLSIYHNSKQEAMKAGDLKKNRSLLRVNAQNLTRGATLLQESAQRLQP